MALGSEKECPWLWGPREKYDLNLAPTGPKEQLTGKKAEMKPQVQDWQVASGQIADGLTLRQGKSWTGLFESKP